MKQFRYVITDPVGIHARPAGQLVKAVKVLDSNITIEKKDSKAVSAAKLMALMGLGVKGGDEVTIAVEGGDEDASLSAMKQFFKENL